MSEFDELLATRRAELETERDEALVQLPAAREAYETAFKALEIAQFKYNSVVFRVTRATAEARTLSHALDEILNIELAKYRVAGAELTRAKDRLAAVRWLVECRNHDLAQLQRLADPPRPALSLERVERPQPAHVEVDDIVFLPAPTRAA
jgi:hypothetical protein